MTSTAAINTIITNHNNIPITMKRITIYITTLLLLFSINNVLGQSIWENPIDGENPSFSTSNPFTSGDITDPNITVSGIGRGSGISGNDASDRYNANGWNATALDPTAYF